MMSQRHSLLANPPQRLHRPPHRRRLDYHLPSAVVLTAIQHSWNSAPSQVGACQSSTTMRNGLLAGCDIEIAPQFLESVEWDVDRAVSTYLEQNIQADVGSQSEPMD